MFGGLKKRAAPIAPPQLADVFAPPPSSQDDIILPPPPSPTPTPQLEFDQEAPPLMPPTQEHYPFLDFPNAQVEEDNLTEDSFTEDEETIYALRNDEFQAQLTEEEDEEEEEITLKPIVHEEAEEEEADRYLPPPPPMFSSSSEEDEKREKKAKRRQSTTTTTAPRYSVGNVKLRLKSSTLNTWDLRKKNRMENAREKRVKIQVLGPGQIRVLLFYERTKRHPILNTMEQARDVLEWYTETKFIGVRALSANRGYACYFILNGEVIHVERFLFTSAEQAARKHDELGRANGITYHTNFRNPEAAGDSKRQRILPSSDLRYTASVRSRVAFVDSNIVLMRRLIARLYALWNAQTARKAATEELWTALTQAIKLAENWNSHHASFRVRLRDTMLRLAQVSKLLKLCFRVGDALLCAEPHNKESDEGKTYSKRLAAVAASNAVRKNRLAWSRGFFQIVLDLHKQISRARANTSAQMQAMFAWAVNEALKLEFGLLPKQDWEAFEAFALKLEQYGALKYFEHDAGFQHILGLVTHRVAMRDKDVEQFKLAQQHFCDALALDAHFRPSLAALANVEIAIQKMHEEMMYGANLMSLSQRSAQSSQQSTFMSHSDEDEDGGHRQNGNNDSSSEEEEDGRKRRTLVAPSAARQNAAPVNAASSVNALAVLNKLLRQEPHYPPIAKAWNKLVLHEEEESRNEEGGGNGMDQAVVEEKRQAIMRWVALDGTLGGGAVDKLTRLWRLSRNGSNAQLVQCFWAVCDCTERLTQRECPTHSLAHYNPVSLGLWELLVCILNHLPQDTIVFDAERAKLWRTRFFALEDVLQFRPSAWRPFRFNQRQQVVKLEREEYLVALKAVFAHMCLIAPEYHFQAVKQLGVDSVNQVSVRRAMRSCERAICI